MPPKSKSAKKQETSSKAKATSNNTSQTAQRAQGPLNWPVISPLIPSGDLSIIPLLENQILTVPQFWTTSLCKTYVSFLSGLPFSTTPGKPKRGEAVRVNDRFQIDDPDFAELLWSQTALKEIVQQPMIEGKTLSNLERDQLWDGEVVGLNSNIRIYRYTKGQFFDQHSDYEVDDESNNVMFPSASSANATPAKTTWTLLLYLSSPATGCKGGETIFYPDPPNKREAPPPPIISGLEVGKALLHRHGKHCLLHEGHEVTEGEKWVIRSDLCVLKK